MTYKVNDLVNKVPGFGSKSWYLFLLAGKVNNSRWICGFFSFSFNERKVTCILHKLWKTFQQEEDGVAFELSEFLKAENFYTSVNAQGTIEMTLFKSFLSLIEDFKISLWKTDNDNFTLKCSKYILYLKTKLQYASAQIVTCT